ncbi:succinyl-CoA:3-ketoacid-coenzyme A transferase-like protein [Meredithblackwellia eburnea MCA 4105]
MRRALASTLRHIPAPHSSLNRGFRLHAPLSVRQLHSARPLFAQPASPSATTQERLRSDKVWSSADEAVKDIKSGSMILSAGFGLCGTAETIITAIANRPELKNLTAVSNNAGNSGDGGLAPLIKSGQVNSMILSFVGSNKNLEQAYLQGKISLELSPQGTLAERIACGGKGVPGFYTATGAGTFVETGQIPLKFAERKEGEKELRVEKFGKAKDVKVFGNGKRYLLEEAIIGDVAIVRAWKVDKAGNCVFRYSTRAFGGLMARAAKLTIVEAENIVEIGEIDAMDINLPGIYVDRIVPATVPGKIEIITTTPPPSASGSPAESESSAPALTGEKLAARLRREKVAKRAAKELKDGFYCNLGVGMPTLAVSYIKPGVKVWLQSENGILGMGPFPTPDKVDGDLVNAGKETVTLVDGASVFDSVESFGMIRGGHVDVSILGAMEVSAAGDLASYYIPKKLVKGMGGSMDLVSNPDSTKVIVATDHTDKYGKSKIKQICSLPLTGSKVVSRIITNLCVFDVDRSHGVLTLVELADGVTVEEVKAKTEASFVVAENLGRMEDD